MRTLIGRRGRSMKQFPPTTPPLGSDTPNLSGIRKWLDLAAKINLLILAGSLFLVLFVMIFALDPLSEGTYSDPMVVMSASYLVAVLFGILALRQKKALIVVMFAYVAFFAANWLDMKRTEDASLAFCAVFARIQAALGPCVRTGLFAATASIRGSFCRTCARDL